MYKRLFYACTLAGALLANMSCTSTSDTSVSEINIIPLPCSISQESGSFLLKDGMTIGISDKSLMPAAEYLSSLLNRSTGYHLSIQEGEEGDIQLSLADSFSPKEGSYSLHIDKKKVTISSGNYGGFIAGIQTIRQLFPAEIESMTELPGNTWTLPAVTITDEPRFSWRGVMLDVSRHFYSPDEVKELLDLMALYKLNKFHWHLTDDQGWRIEIKKYPLLTEKGAWRPFNSQDRECMRRAQAEDNSDFEIPAEKLRIVQGDTLYGGFYTQEEIKEIVRYAGIRGIDVIPEIDMPGHMLAAVSNYGGVSCFAQTGWGKTFSSPVCPGKESALEFCKNVYAEVIPLFPYKYIHLGADEVEKTNWKKCPDCQKRMKEEGLKTEEELQSWFVHYMEHFFNEHGKNLIGWDEILEGGLSETATIMWWRNWYPQSLPEATAQGNQAIYCPNANFYLDVQQDRKSVRNLYEYVLAPDSLSEAQRSLILGAQGNIWCEWIPSRERMHYMAFPRVMALAEKTWSNPDMCYWDDFQKRMIGQFERLNILDVNYRTPDLEGFHAVNAFVGETNVCVTCADPSVEIHYTTNGTIPTLESPAYTGPMKINESTDYIFRTFKANGKAGDIFRTRYIKQEYAPADANAQPQKTGLQATWHEGRFDSCAAIQKIPAKETFEITDVTIPSEVKGDIGLVIKGYINIPAEGVYTFSLLSDDGSILKIDDEIVVNNDGPHAPAEISGQRALAKGLHPIEVQYFDYNGGLLQLNVYDPSGKKMDVNTGIYAY